MIFILLLLLLRNSPFTPLDYFDEHNYLLSSQNIIENGVNSICAVDEGGQCQNFNIPPHGLGVSSIYALLYDYDFEMFYKKIAIFNLLLYLFNAVFIFIIVARIFSNRNVSRVAAFLTLVMPFNMIYATTVMPATISNTFFLVSMYCLVRLMESRREGDAPEVVTKGSFSVPLFCALAILSTIRIEYCIVFTVFIVMMVPVEKFLFGEGDCLLGKALCFSRERIFQILRSVMMTGVAVMVYCYANFYLRVKSLNGGAVGFEYVNWSYVAYYFKNAAFWGLSGFFVFYIFRMMGEIFKNDEMIKSRAVKIVLFGVFFFYVALYSFYNFQSTYRFIIPVTSIYVLFSSAGLYTGLKALIKDERWVSYVLILCLVGISVFFVKDGMAWKRELIVRQHNQEFIELISGERLKDIVDQYGGESHYFFRAPYLGQVTRMRNYLDDYEWAVRKLREGNNLFYLAGPFERIFETPLNNPNEFIVHEEEGAGAYGVYRIELRENFPDITSYYIFRE